MSATGLMNIGVLVVLEAPALSVAVTDITWSPSESADASTSRVSPVPMTPSRSDLQTRLPPESWPSSTSKVRESTNIRWPVNTATPPDDVIDTRGRLLATENTASEMSSVTRKPSLTLMRNRPAAVWPSSPSPTLMLFPGQSIARVCHVAPLSRLNWTV